VETAVHAIRRTPVQFALVLGVTIVHSVGNLWTAA
jgi:hypothetical protein